MTVMEKSYRDLFEALERQAPGNEELAGLIRAVGEVDDTDPLRVHAIKAMKKSPPPPINLIYEYQNSTLTLYARNTIRKRKAALPAQCVAIAVPAWLFDARATFQGQEQTRAACVELVHRSFGYLEIRIANYFTLDHDVRLTRQAEPPSVLVLERCLRQPEAEE
jgi:hypothetical protein